MEQVQRYLVKFDKTTLDIIGLGLYVEAQEGYHTMPVDWELIEPFFTLQKTPSHYYPLTKDGQVIGFRRKAFFENQIVLNSEGDTVKSLRPFENFIADCKIIVVVEENQISLRYDRHYFDAITNADNIERLKLSQDRVYNIHITLKGNPYALLSSFETTLNPLIENKSISIPWDGTKDISVYAIAKN